MPDVEGGFSAAWGGTGQLGQGVVAPWGLAAAVENVGTAYAPPAPPGGGTEFTPGNLVAVTAIGPADVYRQAHTASVVDMRTGNPLPVARVSIDLQDGSDLWSFSATSAPDAGGSLFRLLTDRVEPPAVQITIDGHVWCFLVETVSRPRADNGRTVTFGGRSLAAIADSPFQLQATYSADAPTTAAQLAASALLAAGVELDWRLVDWVIPENSVSLSATPMGVVRALAAAVGAVVEAHPSEARVSVRSRYEALPNEWAYLQPDVQIHGKAIVTDNYEIADKPAYTGIFVAGQQSGGLTYVKLEGTSGADQAPMVSDALLTEEAARVERARAELGVGGQQARVAATLPVLTGAGQPGVLQRGQLLRVVDPEGGNVEIWHGMVRSVGVSLTMPGESADGFSLRQTVSVERHTKHIVDPETADPLTGGVIPDLTWYVTEPVTVDLSGYHTGGNDPFTWSLRSGALPPGASFSGDSVGGTPTFCGEYAVRFRLTDNVSQMVDYNELTITVGTRGPEWSGGSAASTGALLQTFVEHGDGVFVALTNTPSGSRTSTFYRTADGGQTWQAISTGLTTKQCNVVLYGDGAFLITTGVTSADRALYRSVDGGQTWALNPTALPTSGFWYACRFGNGRFLAARWGSTQLAVSDDAGVTWTTRVLPATKNWFSAVWSGERWILSSRTDRQVYASDDNGETWYLLSTVPGAGTLGTFSACGGLVFAVPLPGTSTSEIWVSSDHGATWETASLPSTGQSILVFYVETQGYWYIVYGGTSAPAFRVLVSIDGVNWETAENQLPAGFTGIQVARAYGNGVAVAANMANNVAAYAEFT